MTEKRGTPIRSIIPFLSNIHTVLLHLWKHVKWQSPLFLLVNATLFFCILCSLLLFPTVTLADTLPYGIGSTSMLAQNTSDDSSIFMAPVNSLEDIEADMEEIDSHTIQGSLLVAPLEPETHETTLHRSYTVKEGDTLDSIANNYHISEDTIRQVNGLYKGASVKTDQTLHIPPRDGILYAMTEQQTIDDLATTYNVPRERILYFNEYLEDSSKSLRGAEVFIPDVDSSKHVKAAPRRRYTSTRYTYSAPQQTPTPTQPQTETTAGFYRGYCTEWAANRTKELGKDAVTWRGNGGTWARNAAAQGRTVDKTPEVGAIVSTTEGQYTGHVAVIEKVNEDGSITISEKNYSGWNKVSERVISPNDPQVLGIIH